MNQDQFLILAESILSNDSVKQNGLSGVTFEILNTSLQSVFQHTIDNSIDGGDPDIKKKLQGIHDGDEIIHSQESPFYVYDGKDAAVVVPRGLSFC